MPKGSMKLGRTDLGPCAPIFCQPRCVALAGSACGVSHRTVLRAGSRSLLRQGAVRHASLPAAPFRFSVFSCLRATCRCVRMPVCRTPVRRRMPVCRTPVRRRMFSCYMPAFCTTSKHGRAAACFRATCLRALYASASCTCFGHASAVLRARALPARPLRARPLRIRPLRAKTLHARASLRTEPQFSEIR